MIVQVREQSKINAANLRESVQQEKERLLRELAVQIQVIPIHEVKDITHLVQLCIFFH